MALLVEALRGALAILLASCWLLVPAQAYGPIEPPSPMVVALHDDGSGGVTLSWSMVVGAESYVVTRINQNGQGVVLYQGQGTIAHDGPSDGETMITYVLSAVTRNVDTQGIIVIRYFGEDCVAFSGNPGWAVSPRGCVSHLPEL